MIVLQAIHQFLKTDVRLPPLQTDTVASQEVADGSQAVHNIIRMRLASARGAGQITGRQKGQQVGKKVGKRGRCLRLLRCIIQHVCSARMAAPVAALQLCWPVCSLHM